MPAGQDWFPPPVVEDVVCTSPAATSTTPSAIIIAPTYLRWVTFAVMSVMLGTTEPPFRLPTLELSLPSSTSRAGT